jgi:hypothetical protein
MQSPAQGFEPEQEPPDVDDRVRARCSGVGPGGSISRSSFSLAANINDPMVN